MATEKVNLHDLKVMLPDKLLEYAEKVGVDGLLLTVPAYNKPQQEGLFQHFKAIAESTELSCVLYNVPSRTSLNMTDETTLRLAEIKNIIGVKEASSDHVQIAKIIANTPEGFKVWSGNDFISSSNCTIFII